MSLITSKFKFKAAIWWSSRKSALNPDFSKSSKPNTYITWNKFKGELIGRFSDPRQQEKLHLTLKKLNQKDKSVAAFTATFKQLVDQITNLMEEDKIFAYKTSLRSNISSMADILPGFGPQLVFFAQ